MAVSRLTDGLPVTTEWLNSLVDEINGFSGSTSGSSTSSTSSNIEVFGSLINSDTGSIRVIAERVRSTADGGTTRVEMAPTFPKPFKDNNVIVVATPSFVSNGTRKGKPFLANASVGAISSKGFLLTISLVRDDMDFNENKEVIVDYIAIGRK